MRESAGDQLNNLFFVLRWLATAPTQSLDAEPEDTSPKRQRGEASPNPSLALRACVGPRASGFLDSSRKQMFQCLKEAPWIEGFGQESVGPSLGKVGDDIAQEEDRQVGSPAQTFLDGRLQQLPHLQDQHVGLLIDQVAKNLVRP